MVKKLKKQYETPEEGWNEERMQREDELSEQYGLRSKKEVYKAQSQLRSLRRQARKLAGAKDEIQKEDFLSRVNSLGLIRESDGLEEVLGLSVTDILDRRLQTAVERRGYADTPLQARQMVVHGKVEVDGQKITVPGYLLTQEEEAKIQILEKDDEEKEEGSESEEVEQDDEEDTEERSDEENPDEEEEGDAEE